jgi:N-acetylmuramoyl-L-alanine amidase
MAAAITLLGWTPLSAQAGDADPVLERMRLARVERSQGFAALWVGVLDAWGFTVSETDGSARALRVDGTQVSVRAGTPFVQVDTGMIQLADMPYERGGSLFVPIQLVFELGGWPVEGDVRSIRLLSPPDPVRRLVVIDPGHGGEDTGHVGPEGVQEKDVALSVALALAEALTSDPRYDVHLTRDRDELVALENRGTLASALQGSRSGVFVSLHANSDPDSRSTRGFETYVLGMARSHEEQRVAEVENGSFAVADSPDGTSVAFAARAFGRRDHTPWSTRLATIVQQELDATHPGTNRGVAHAPLGPLEDALMPAIAVQLGFVSNRADEALLPDSDFQAEMADALMRALDGFFAVHPGAPPSGQVGSRE